MEFKNFKWYHRVLSNDEIIRKYNGEDIKCGCDWCKEKEAKI